MADERYADFVADMTLNGILTRPEEPTWAATT